MLGFKKKQESEKMKEAVIQALKGVHDPEIPVNIYDLGLIYGIDIQEQGEVAIQMTLTSPNCPVAESLPGDVERAVNQVEGVSECIVELVWEPPWSKDRMTEAALLELGRF